MFTPSAIVIDFETALSSGPASHEFYRPDFRVVSCAFSWYGEDGAIKNLYTEGENETRKVLTRIAKQGIPVVVHNLQFEHGVMVYRFPGILLNWHADTMRLVQVADNGGKAAQRAYEDTLVNLIAEYEESETDEDKPKKVVTGLGLQAAISRWLPPEHHNHKEPFYRHLREVHGVKAGKEGGHLHLLPPDLLRAYNVADTDLTLRLYKVLTDKFLVDRYDWTLDHMLYMSAACKIAESRGRGIKVDRGRLKANLTALDDEVAEVWDTFRTRFRNEISALEQENLTKYVLSRSTEKGQLSAWERAIDTPKIFQFNLNSGPQKTRLFRDILGIQPIYFTKKGRPAFGRAFLHQWGDGGSLLAKRGTMLIASRQMQSLLELSAGDGRWHVDLMACGTVTGRFKGGRS